jgi:hypothetical protein
MRILAISDIHRWEGYEQLVYRYRPAVVALAGDLTSDGGAAFWIEGLYCIPGFVKEQGAIKGKLRRAARELQKSIPGRRIVHSTRLPELRPLQDELSRLEIRYRQTEPFLRTKNRHVDKFYRFLEYTGKRSRVLVIKGDHDDDFPGDYDARRIDNIPGCEEISGRTCALKGFVFLGLGFSQAGYVSRLRPLIADFRDRAHVLITHVPQSNLRLMAEFKPRLIIRGHWLTGSYLVDDVPAVCTAGAYARIEIAKTGPPHIRQGLKRKIEMVTSNASGNLETKKIPWPRLPLNLRERSDVSKSYDWMRPYDPPK